MRIYLISMTVTYVCSDVANFFKHGMSHYLTQLCLLLVTIGSEEKQLGETKHCAAHLGTGVLPFWCNLPPFSPLYVSFPTFIHHIHTTACCLVSCGNYVSNKAMVFLTCYRSYLFNLHGCNDVQEMKKKMHKELPYLVCKYSFCNKPIFWHVAVYSRVFSSEN